MDPTSENSKLTIPELNFHPTSHYTRNANHHAGVGRILNLAKLLGCSRDSIALVLCLLPWTVFSCRLSFRPLSQFSAAVPLAVVQMLTTDGDLPREQVRRGFRQSGCLDYRLPPAPPRGKDQEATDSHVTIDSHHIMLNTVARNLSRAILLSFRLCERRSWCTRIFESLTLSRCSLKQIACSHADPNPRYHDRSHRRTSGYWPLQGYITRLMLQEGGGRQPGFRKASPCILIE